MHKLTRREKFLLGALAALAIFAPAANLLADTTPQGQVMYGPGQSVTLTGALPAGNSGASVVIDSVATRTSGDLLKINNGGTNKAKFDLNGVLTVPGMTNTGATSFSNAVTASGSASFDLSGGSGVFKTSTGAVTVGPGAITASGPVTASVAAPVAAATTGTAASTAIAASGQAGGASTGGATNNAAGAGSNDSVISGAGGVASGAATGTNTGGNGGTLQIVTGAGGASSGATTANTGGNGGAETDAGGAGGAASGAGTTNTGGIGGTITNAGGVGGAASGGTTNIGGAGGASNITAGGGGNGTQTGGAGGSISVTAGNAGTGGNAAAGNVTVTAGTATGSGAGGSVTISTSTAGVARAGFRNASSRVIVANKPTAPPDCAGGTLTLTVAQFLEAGIFTCGTAQTVNLPTWQGASGIVQALPGTPAVGDIVQIVGAATGAGAITMGFGTGGTNGNAGHTTVPANSTQTFNCRITAITGGSETATCY